MGDNADIAVTVVFLNDELFDFARRKLALVVCIVSRVNSDILRRVIKFIGKIGAAEYAFLEKPQLVVLEAHRLVKANGCENFNSLLLCKPLYSAVGLRGGGENSAFGLRQWVERKRDNKLSAIKNKVLDELHLLGGEAAERVYKHRIAAENLGMRRKNIVYPVDIVERIDVRLREPAAENVENIRGIEKLLL